MAESISTFRATLILIVAYLLGVVLIDQSGFKKVKEQRFLKIIPVRVTVIYFVALGVIVFILGLFNRIDPHEIIFTYRQVAVISILAMLGAASADLIGNE